MNVLSNADHATASAMLVAGFGMLVARRAGPFHAAAIIQSLLLAFEALLASLASAGFWIAGCGLICAMATITPHLPWLARRNSTVPDDGFLPGVDMIVAALAGSVIVLIAIAAIVPVVPSGMATSREIPALGVAICLLSLLVIVLRPYRDTWKGGLSAFANGLSLVSLLSPRLLPGTTLIVVLLSLTLCGGWFDPAQDGEA